MAFQVNALVDVRAAKADIWRPGKVVEVREKDYKVQLDAPVSRSAWTGKTSRWGDGQTSEVFVTKNADKFATGDLIRARS